MLRKSKMLTIMEHSWRFDLQNSCCLGLNPSKISSCIRKRLEKSSYNTVHKLYISFLKKYKGSFQK